MECQASTLLLDVQKETHCLVRFGKSFESRYTMFVQQKDIITHHNRAFAFVLPIESPEPSPTWPLGSHVSEGDVEGSHGAHLNLKTVMTTCIITVWTLWHVH